MNRNVLFSNIEKELDCLIFGKTHIWSKMKQTLMKLH